MMHHSAENFILQAINVFMIFIIVSADQKPTGNLVKYLQKDDVGDIYEFASPDDLISCTRVCQSSSPPRVCYYRFHLEDYATLTEACQDCWSNGTSCDLPQCVTADGHERGIMTANRKLPGPSIQVCYGDRIIVDVFNKMPARSTTIHWHGIFQRGTQYNDGVPMISQCPIVERNVFRYDFYANQPGTYYWHSHDGIQKIDGLQGSLIIRRPKEQEPNGILYDYDLPAHVLFLNDWYHTDSAQHFPGLIHPNPSLYATYYLINGKGRYTDHVIGNTTKTPYAELNVKKGKAYRIRIIGATCRHCYARLSIEGHKLKLIATDGNSVKPVDVDYLDIFSGERFDFVLNATNEIKRYWIMVRGLGPCEEFDSYQLAILKYEGSTEEEPKTPVPKGTVFNVHGMALNPVNSTCHDPNGVCVAQLEAIEDFNQKIMKTPDISFKVDVGYAYPDLKEEYQSHKFERYSHPDPYAPNTVMWLNNIYSENPPSPILSQREDIPSGVFCPKGRNGLPECKKDLCRCFHLLKVPLGALVQFIFVDLSDGGGFNHPFHLHGYAFNVMAMGYMKSGMNTSDHIEKLMKKNSLTTSPAPVLKDTVAVPSAGYAVVRFIADNPGYWLFHCHFMVHHITGMSLTVQVGEPSDLPPVPKGFPKCGNYAPDPALEEGPKGSSLFGKFVQWVKGTLGG